MNDAISVPTAADCESDYNASIWRTVLSSYEGRVVINQLLENLGVGEFPSSAYAGDPYDTAYNCGRQDAGKVIREQVLTVAPEMLIMMANEAKDRQTKFEAEALGYLEGRELDDA